MLTAYLRPTFPLKAEIAATASSLVANDTNPYPEDLPAGPSNTTLLETGLQLVEKNSLK
jgi:hypothetical protein